jgi:transposase
MVDVLLAGSGRGGFPMVFPMAVSEEGRAMDRRVVGMDLGIASAHTAVVVDRTGTVVARRKAYPTVGSFETLEAAALAGAEPGTRLEVVIEPTGPAWLPVAVWFTGRGHVVYRVSSQKAADLRRFLNRHAKSNGIDALTLAKLPLFDPDGLRPVDLAEGPAASLDRRVRTCARLSNEIGSRKRRIRDLARQAMPTINIALGQDLGRADLAVLERYSDPRRLLATGKGRVAKLIAKASRGQCGSDKAEAFIAAARAAVDLHEGSTAVAWEDLAEVIASQIRLLRATEAELARHTGAREAAYRRVEDDELTRSLPGIAEVGGPMVTAAMGDPDRFPRGGAFKAFTGLAPKASETGDTDRKGQAITKAGNSDLRTQLILTADAARTLDPQLAKVYYDQMVHRGANHTKACAVVAAKLAERAWAVRKRGTPYELRDVDGTPVTPEQAKKTIAEHWTVPEHIRAQRRSKKSKGRAPQPAPSGQATKRSKRNTRRPSQASTVGPDTEAVNPLAESA